MNARNPVKARRILITGVSSQLGGRLAQTLEREPGVEAIIGVDTEDPRHELQRTEFVRVAVECRPLRRILAAAGIDTVLDTRLVADPLQASLGTIHATNLTGTAELLSACRAPESRVRHLVFKSSAHAYGWAAGDPAFFSEDAVRSHPPRTALEREIVGAEEAVQGFAARHRACRVAILRVADEVGSEGRSSLLSLLSLPIIPGIIGFDPRFQVIHTDDVVGALAHAVRAELGGTYNAAGDGVLALSEVASVLGKPLIPVLPPWGAGFAAGQLRRLGLRVPVETVRALRHGRGLDNRRLKATGFTYRYTTREALIKLRAEQRRHPLLGSGSETYRYEPDLEDFLRWSPSVRTAHSNPAQRRDGQAGFDRLAVGELVDLIPSLEPDALETLRTYELAHQRRPAVLEALDGTLERKRP